MSSATLPAVVANGAGSMPSVIFVATKPGPDDHDAHARADQPVAETLGEPVEPGLGRPVGAVLGADPLAGDGREHHDRALALPLHAVGDDEERRDLAAEVHRDRLGRLGRVRVVVVLVAQDAECGQHEVDLGGDGRTRRRAPSRGSADRARRTRRSRPWSRRRNGSARRSLRARRGDGRRGPRCGNDPAIRRSTVSMAMSDPPPSTNTDCTPPNASRIDSPLWFPQPVGSCR